MKASLNIALIGRDFCWGGGMELLRNIANALLSVQKQSGLKLFLLLPVINRVDTWLDIGGIVWRTARNSISQKKIIVPRQEPAVDESFIDFFKNIDGEIEIIEYNKHTGLISALRRIRADVIMPSASPFKELFPFPWVGYICDFQHKYYSGYFSARECLDRDIHFATMLRNATAVIVNAHAVQDDIEKFFPYRTCKIFNLPFSAAPVSSWLKESNSSLVEHYRLPLRYFLISNQFWIHKSHITAFRALELLKNDTFFGDLHIVCTGKMEDYRFPNYIRDLQREIYDLGITEKVHFLGHIPKSDQIAIMKRALAVLQPTLFEGGPGGGAVYDAISLGIPALISDIPVNREIENEANVFYFKADVAVDLAKTIRLFLQKNISRPTKETLVARGEERKRLMGEQLLTVAEFVKFTHRNTTA